MNPLDSNTAAAPGATADSLDFAAGGPGWYESSRELRSGLDVAIGLPADAPLDDWIAACLLQRNVRPSAIGTAALAFARRITASPSAMTAIA